MEIFLVDISLSLFEDLCRNSALSLIICFLCSAYAMYLQQVQDFGFALVQNTLAKGIIIHAVK